MKKKINIVLLLFVVGVWGTVIYRYVNRFFMEDPNQRISRGFSGSFNSKTIAKDSFTFGTISRDPFLNTARTERKVYRKSTYTAKKTVVTNVPRKPPVISSFPIVKYYGFIKSTGREKELILVSINGKFSRLKLNENHDGLKVTSLQKDSIKVSYNKETRWFLKK